MAVVIGLCIFAAGCSEDPEQTSDDELATAPKGQVIASVNGQEITTHQLGAEMVRINISPQANREDIERKVLQALIERTTLEQKAADANMDRVPSVLMKLLRSRSAILSQAYIAQRMAEVEPVTRQEAEEFVGQNPHMFENREYFVFDNIRAATADIQPEMRDELETFGTLDKIEARLRQLGIEHRRQPRTAFSESILLEMLNRMDEIERDDTVFFMVGGAVTYISRLQNRRPAVLTGEEALTAATNILRAKKNEQFLTDLRSEIVAESEIEFFGNYADMTIAQTVDIDLETVEQIEQAVQESTEPENDSMDDEPRNGQPDN